MSTPNYLDYLHAQRDHLARQVVELSAALRRRDRDFQALAEAMPEEGSVGAACVAAAGVGAIFGHILAQRRCGNCVNFRTHACPEILGLPREGKSPACGSFKP